MTRRQASQLLWLIWTGTVTIWAITGLAVWQHRSTGSMHAQMPGMDSTGSALIRLRSQSPLGPLLGSRLLTTWQLDAVAVILLSGLTAAYLTGLVLVGLREPGQRWPIGRTLSFLAGIAVCVLATNGSIAVYDMSLFSAHMIGHLAFVMLAPALLMIGRPMQLALGAARPPMRRRLQAAFTGRIVTALTAPPFALACYAAVIVASHLTGLMDTIMRSEWAGQIEHLAYLVIGCQFFIVVLGDAPIRWQLSSPVRWLLLAVSMAVDTFTGLTLLQSTQPVYMTPMPGLSVNALSDTRTGGAIMWFAGDAIMAAFMIALVIGWLRDPQRRQLDNASWLEQARRATFAERTGAVGAAKLDAVQDLNFDDEDDRLTAYNSWLAGLDRNGRS